MHDQTFFVLLRRHLPHFFDTNAVSLRIFARVQIKFAHQTLAQMTARTFGEDGVFRVQLHARLILTRRLTVFANTHIARYHAFHRAVFIVQHIRSGKARIDFNTRRLGLLAHPANDIGQTDNIRPIIVETFRQQPQRCRFHTCFRQEQKLIRRHRHIQRRAQLFPVREQLIHRDRIHHRTRQNMRAQLRTFINQTHIDVGIQLLQANCRRQTGRTTAHDQDIIFHHIALDVRIHTALLKKSVPKVINHSAVKPAHQKRAQNCSMIANSPVSYHTHLNRQ